MKIWEKERQKAAVRGERGLMTKQLNVVDHKSNYLKPLFHPCVGERRKRQFLQVGGSHYNGGEPPQRDALGTRPTDWLGNAHQERGQKPEVLFTNDLGLL